MTDVCFSGDLFVGQRVGGATRYYSELLSLLPNLGTTTTTDLRVHISQYLSHTPTNGRFINLPTWRGSEYAFSKTVGRLRTHEPERAKIFHPTYYTSEPKRGKINVVTVLDMIHELFPSIYGPENATTKRKRLWVNCADIVIAISESTAADLKRIPGFSPNSVQVVPLGVDDRFLECPIEQTLRDQNLVLYVGGRGGYKNWEAAAIAMSDPRHSEKHLLNIGGGPATKEEVSKIARLGLQGRVTFRSASDQMIVDSLRRAAVLLYPSLYEGFGLPLIEARATGCPVIATRGSSVTEVAGPNSILTDGSPEALAEALTKIPFTQTAGEQGLRKWIDCAVDHHNIYQRLLLS